MKLCTAKKVGLLSAALMFVFTLSTIAPAEAKQFSLKAQLKKSGVSMKIVRLDRADGFLFGLSFTGPQGNTFVLAPGFGGTFLFQRNGDEVIMQRDAEGKMQVIESTGDISLVLCYVQCVVTFINDLTTCSADAQSGTACIFSSIIQLVTSIMTCSSTAPVTGQ